MSESGRRRRHADDSSEDSDGSSHRSKRLKFDGRHASVELGGDVPESAAGSEFQTAKEGDDSDVENAQTKTALEPESGGSDDDHESSQSNVVLLVPPRLSKSDIPHSPGAIVRVQLANFVTYSSAEFHPGPLLNMIIGPNGTGKSTFVCAVCLGLGWGPQVRKSGQHRLKCPSLSVADITTNRDQVLGRAKDVADFVKHGCRQAVIEIELQGRPGKTNPVIRRVIRRDGSKTLFYINNQTVPQKRVLELAKSYSIQIDNLCQFLPQDKVAEFAAMTPVELLKSTQRAAAAPQMLQWHEELVELRKQQKEALKNNAAHKELLASLERRHDMQREDVERMRQRDEIKKRIKSLGLYKPFVKFKDLTTRTIEARDRAEAMKREEEELRAQVAPILESANSKKEYCESLENVVKQRRNAVTLADAEAEKAKALSKTLEEKIEQLNEALKTERKRGESIRNDKQKYTQLISKVNRQLEEEAPEFNAAAYNERLRNIVREIRELEEKHRETTSQHEEADNQYRRKNREIQALEHRYSNLESQTGQQEEKLLKLSSDTYHAYQWIKNNQQKFEKEVFGPPVVECWLRDLRYADVVESSLGRSDLQAFTVQTQADFRTMQ
ncbi:Structural maintenance of chromosomes protein 5, partial [Ascosphaera aggregata]